MDTVTTIGVGIIVVLVIVFGIAAITNSRREISSRGSATSSFSRVDTFVDTSLITDQSSQHQQSHHHHPSPPIHTHTPPMHSTPSPTHYSPPPTHH